MSQKPSSLTTVSCCPHTLLANQDKSKHTSPAPEQAGTHTGLAPATAPKGLPSLLLPHSLVGVTQSSRERLGSWLGMTAVLPARSSCPRRKATVQMDMNTLFPPDSLLNTEIHCRCTVSQSSSSLLLLGYTTRLPQHLSCTACIDQVTVQSDKTNQLKKHPSQMELF